jgi:ComF family protein
VIKTITTYINHFTHIFFPHVCEGCGSDILDTSSFLCVKCFYQLPETGFINTANNKVEKIFYGRLIVEEAASAYYFTKGSLMQRLLIQLKYRNNKELAFYLGTLIGNQILQTTRFKTIDLIIPVPLNKERQKKRGYNQSAEIAKGIASIISIPVFENALARNIFTETQTHKNRINRWQTMQHIFSTIKPDDLINKHILLIDDVLTTGATIEGCGNEILSVPGTKLSIITLAYTL